MAKKIKFEEEEELLRQYEEVRQEFYYPPTRIAFDAPESAPFYIQKGDLHICPTKLKTELYNKSIFRHEVAHFCICPMTVETCEDMHDRAKKGLGKPYSDQKGYSQYAQLVSNVVSDLVVDEDNFRRKNDPTAERYRLATADPEVTKSLKTDRVKNILVGVVNKFTGEEIVPILPDCKTYVNKLHKICIEDRIPAPAKAEKAAALLKDIIDKTVENQMKQLEQDLDKFLEKVGFNKKQIDEIKDNIKKGVQDSKNLKDSHRNNVKANLTKEEWAKLGKFSEDTGTSGKTLAEADKQTKDKLAKGSQDKGEYRRKLQQYGIGDESGDGAASETLTYYKAKAINNICFKVKVRGQSGGKIVKGGLIQWNPEENPENLDIEETIGLGGVMIPTVTTVQYDSVHGVNEETQTIPKAMIILDTSGSMPEENALVTIFSLIESAKANYIPVSVIAFSSGVVYTNGSFSYEYHQTEQGIVDNYNSGGTNMLPALNEAKKQLLKEHDPALVIIVSDYETNEYSESIKAIKELAKKHRICPIKFGSGSEGKELTPIRINNLEDLYKLVVEAFNAYIESAKAKKEGEQ